MNYAYITYYYPPDYGAGSFRSDSFIKKFSKKINSSDNLHIITTIPNRYKYDFKIKKNLKKKNVYIHRIKIINHQEKLIKKTLAGIIYFIVALYLLFKIKPKIIIASSARLVSGLIAYIYSRFFNSKYFLDLRDLFSYLMLDIYKNNFIASLICKIFMYVEKKIILNAISVNFVSPGFDYCLNLRLKKKTFYSNGYDENYLKDLKKTKFKDYNKKTITYAGNIGIGQSLEKFLPTLARFDSSIKYKIIGNGGRLEELKNKINRYKLKNIFLKKQIKRNILIKNLKSSDILLISLADYKSLKYVIPSKIFEYILYKKPIVANFNGFIKNYSKKNFDNVFFFKGPRECYKKIQFILKNKKKLKFKKNYKLFSRDKIMDDYTDHILRLSKNIKNY